MTRIKPRVDVHPLIHLYPSMRSAGWGHRASLAVPHPQQEGGGGGRVDRLRSSSTSTFHLSWRGILLPAGKTSWRRPAALAPVHPKNSHPLYGSLKYLRNICKHRSYSLFRWDRGIRNPSFAKSHVNKYRQLNFDSHRARTHARRVSCLLNLEKR
jgi:hypothetical protein